MTAIMKYGPITHFDPAWREFSLDHIKSVATQERHRLILETFISEVEATMNLKLALEKTGEKYGGLYSDDALQLFVRPWLLLHYADMGVRFTGSKPRSYDRSRRLYQDQLDRIEKKLDCLIALWETNTDAEQVEA